LQDEVPPELTRMPLVRGMGQLWFLDREKLNSGAKCGGFYQQMGIEWG